MTATTADLIAYTGLPCEVPVALLEAHLAIALRDLVADMGTETAPEGAEDDWDEAQIVRALASVLPHLHTFSLSGAAKAGRLVGADNAIEFRFFSPGEVRDSQDRLERRYQALLGRIRGALDPAEGASPGPVGLYAV